MVDGIKSWIVNIGCTIFFITAVEMILPDNSMKKYAKFVLGLILITTMITPIIYFLYGGINNSAYINKIYTELQVNNSVSNVEKYKQQNINNTLKVFEDNLKVSCEKTLKDKYTGFDFTAGIVAEYNKESSEFQIKEITIKTNYAKIQDIQGFLSDKLGVSKDNIKVSKDR